jgi:hypothetical protein
MNNDLSLLIINIKTFAFKKAGEHEWLAASLAVKRLAETKGYPKAQYSRDCASSPLNMRAL